MQRLDDNDGACPECGCRSALVAGGNWPGNGIAVVCVSCRSARIGRLVRDDAKIAEQYPSDQDASVHQLPSAWVRDQVAQRIESVRLGYRLRL